jgi:hypothetical protein
VIDAIRRPAALGFKRTTAGHVTRMPGRRFNLKLTKSLKVGAVWERTRGEHEQAVRILKEVNGRVGERYLVEGLESGRQWLVSHSTLLDAYRPIA